MNTSILTFLGFIALTVIYTGLNKKWNGKYSRQLLDTIDWCLRLDHLERPQSVLALQKVLLRERDPVVSAAPAAMNLRGMMTKLSAWRKRTVN